MTPTIQSHVPPHIGAMPRCCALFVPLVVVFCTLLSACTVAQKTSSVAVKQAPVTVNLRVGSAIEIQKISGFGATTLAGIMVSGAGVRDLLGDSLRGRAIKAMYGDVGLNLGSLQLWQEPGNDNEDPLSIEENGYRWDVSEAIFHRLVMPAQPYGFTDYALGLTIDMGSELAWMKALRKQSYHRYLQEVAEHVLAGVSHWQEFTGSAPRLVTLFNEPLSGNRELRGGSVKELVDIIKFAGNRLHAEGFTQTKFIVPAEETVGKTIETSEAILADSVARSYVGVLAYHAYPYDSAYSSIRKILETSAQGLPDPYEIQQREELYRLASRYNIPLWMTESSEGPGRADYPFGSPKNLRGRANHIHDELVYANASAYFAMYNLWDRESHEAHFQNRNIDMFSESSHIVLADQETSTIHISGIGYAIGHYARWITPGSLRVAAVSDNHAVKVTAFRSDKSNRLTLVIINNAKAEAEVNIEVNDAALQGVVKGEYSGASERWKPLPAFPAPSAGAFRLTTSPESVTSITIPLVDPG